MVWISFVAVVLFFYRPFLGFGRQIIEHPRVIPVLVPGLSISSQYDFNYDLLLLASVVVWVAAASLLLAAERWAGIQLVWQLRMTKPLKYLLSLRDGLLYSLFPPVVIRAAMWLAQFILGYYLLTLVIDILVAVGGGVLPGLLIDALVSLRHVLFDLDFEVVTLSAFTWIATKGFLLEQQWRYEKSVHTHDLMRKDQQNAIRVR